MDRQFETRSRYWEGAGLSFDSGPTMRTQKRTIKLVLVGVFTMIIVIGLAYTAALSISE